MAVMALDYSGVQPDVLHSFFYGDFFGEPLVLLLFVVLLFELNVYQFY